MKSILIGILLFISSASMAQGSMIQGRVIDDNGINISGAIVVIESINRQTSTDIQGNFFLLDLNEGHYTLKIYYSGYKTLEKEIKLEAHHRNIEIFTLTTNSVLLDDVVLNVYLNDNRLRDINSQKNKANITNVVSIDQTGKFPDANIGDALKRIPGITMQVKEGEAQDIIIRGLAPELNSVTINGSRAPSTNGDNRSVQLDVIPTDMIESIEVAKALTPDMEADALGGSVNLITRTAPHGFRLSTTLGSGINLISDKRIWNTNFLIGSRSKNKKFGWMISATVNDNDYGSHSIEAEWGNTLEYNTGNTNMQGEAIIEEVDVSPYTNTLLEQTFFLQRVRRSLAANFEYMFNNNHTVFFKSFLNWRDDRENRFVFESEILDPIDIAQENFTLNGTNLINFPVEISRQTIGGANSSRSKNGRLEVKRLQNFSVGGTHLFKNVKTDWLASFADASEKVNERLAEYKSEYSVFNDVSNTRFPFLRPLDLDDANNLSNFEFEEIVEEVLFNKEEDFNFLVNTEIPSSILGFNDGTIKFGLKNRFKYKARNNDFTFFDFEDDYPTLGDVPVTNYSDPDFLVGEKYKSGFFADKKWLSGLNLINGETIGEEFLRQHYSIKENVFASYMMLNEKIKDKLHVVAGARLEHTNIKAKANNIENPDDFNRVTNEKSYTNILPGIHLKYNFSKQSIIKFAWTNTLARPNYVDLVPTLEIVLADEEIILGNPELDATTSMNFDISAEHYFKSFGIISAGLFYKNIKGFIYTFKSETTDDRFGSGTSGFTTFKPLNGDSASLFGAEIAFQKRLSFLPGFAKNFNVNINYTYIDSNANGIRNSKGEERDDLDLPNTARHTLNTALGYDDKMLSTRLALNFSDRYIENIGGNSFEDIYYDKQLFLDFNINYVLKKHLSIYVAVNNITNQPLRLYQGISARTAQAEYYDRRFAFGLKYDLFKKQK
ncbi:TonB-dependent receptor [Flavivirga abyssicola]|uniref:TonB-dependent receptor n=1 Tax=Flavivirga abyssicola TaxID=3063533 RepID=UPI0026E029A8|nr:TonB-dependent receptor [Flavivirga sp. MEBiC07777]WVK12745.1 TonB-dependent receptor [Flavivirga sp. MEBiC07777]